MGWFTRTYTALEFSSITTKDVVCPVTWLGIGAINFGNMKNFNGQWFSFKKKYADNFAFKNVEKKLLALGNNTTGIGSKLTVNDSKLSAQIGSPVSSSKVDFPDAMTLARNNLQQQYGQAWNGTSATVGNKTVTLVSAKFTGIKMGVNSKVSTAKFGYQTSTVTLADPNDPTSGGPPVITKSPSNQNKYRQLTVVASHGTGKVFLEPVASASGYTERIPVHLMPLVDLQERKGHDPVGSKGRKIKEWYLTRLGIDADELYKKTLKTSGTTDIDNMYVTFGVLPKDPYVLDGTSNNSNCGVQKAKDIQEWSDKFLKKSEKLGNRGDYKIPCGGLSVVGSPEWWRKKNKLRSKKFANFFYSLMEYYGSTTLEVTFSVDLNIATLIDSKFSLVNGVIKQRYTGYSAGVGYAEFDRKQKSDGTITGLVVKKQLTPTQYGMFDIADIEEKIQIGEESFTLHMDGSWTSTADKDDKGGQGTKYPRIMIPQSLYWKADFMTKIVLKEYGLELTMFAKQEVDLVSWKTLFGIVLVVVSCVGPWAAAACPNAIGYMATYFAGVAAGTAVGVGYVVAASVVYGIAMAALQIGLQLAMENIDNAYLRGILGIAISAGIGMLTGGLDLTQLSSEAYLNLATQVTTIVYSAYTQAKMKEIAEAKQYAEAGKNLEKKMDSVNDFESGVMQKAYTGAHFSAVEANGPERLYSSVENLTNYDQFYNVDHVIEFRKNVVPG